MPANNRCLVWRNGATPALGNAQAPAQAASSAEIRPPTSRTDLFISFTLLALQGFGGVLAVVQREVVEKKRWLTREQFVEDWAVAQVLPGPNVMNLSLMIGARYFGISGALAAMAGMVLLPLLIVLGMAFAYASLANQPWMASALRGMGAAAAGLIAASSIKLLPALWHNVLGARNCKALVAVSFFAVAWMRLPLLWVVIGLGLPACLLAWRKLRALDTGAAS
ncbi:MAG: chromate transporter [Burkholderiales bacterium]